ATRQPAACDAAGRRSPSQTSTGITPRRGLAQGDRTMAVDMFLKLDGIKGESKDAKHKDEIHIESFSWNFKQPYDVHGGGMGTGKLQVNALKINKYVDASSPDLLLCISNGKHIKEGLITVRKAGEHPVEYLKIKLTQILITELDYQGQSEADGE